MTPLGKFQITQKGLLCISIDKTGASKVQHWYHVPVILLHLLNRMWNQILWKLLILQTQPHFLFYIC